MRDRDQRARHALEQAGRSFMGTADVQLAATRVAAKLEELGIPLCDLRRAGGHGARARAHHGRRRRAADARGAAPLQGGGARPRLARALRRQPRRLRHRAPDRGRFLLAGGSPGDGKPRGVRFLDPGSCTVTIAGKRYLELPRLIELKLASGLSAPDRPRDFDDVIQLIRANALPESYSEGLHQEVRAKSRELWGYAQRPTGEY